MQVDPQALQSISQRHALGFLAIFGSSARGKPGRDMDIAVMPLNPLEDLRNQEQLFEDLSRALHPTQVDLTLLPNVSWLLNWQVARDGICLLGQDIFERFQQSAFWRQVYQASLRAAPLWRTYLERISEKLP